MNRKVSVSERSYNQYDFFQRFGRQIAYTERRLYFGWGEGVMWGSSSAPFPHTRTIIMPGRIFPLAFVNFEEESLKRK